MPNKLSTWIDICVTLIVSLILLVILFPVSYTHLTLPTKLEV